MRPVEIYDYIFHISGEIDIGEFIYPDTFII